MAARTVAARQLGQGRGACVPLDPSYPAERLAHILRDTELEIVLTQQHLCSQLPPHTAQDLCLDSGWSCIDQERADPVRSRCRPDNLTYVIYTSSNEVWRSKTPSSSDFDFRRGFQVRIKAYRFFEFIAGFLPPSRVPECQPEIVMGSRVIRIETDRLPKLTRGA